MTLERAKSSTAALKDMIKITTTKRNTKKITTPVRKKLDNSMLANVVGGVNKNVDSGVQIRNGVSNGRNHVGDLGAHLVVGADVDSPDRLRQWTKLFEPQVTEIDCLLNDVQPIRDHSDLGDNVTGDRGGGVNVKVNGVVAWEEFDIEVRRC
ncbi:hypothetical protein WICPIJ_004161 [Wickerhamomyces pijperi]|uniref:Uncharacterized protein n=1 Tax=Wickerhamomyces pijperi TaxID=599730 RepID=A0A9P8TMA8_WICPI|nr:hypothetical protein WICPIJ_004161 [Wickerhamomyces pijperi]